MLDILEPISNNLDAWRVAMLVAGWLKEGTFEYHEAHIGFLKHHAIMHVQANNFYFILYMYMCVYVASCRPCATLLSLKSSD